MATTTGGSLPINSLITPTTVAPPKASSLTQQLGADAFLKLLTTQLQNQNPLQPMDDTQSIAQLAQFSAVQATTDLKDSFASFQSTFAVMQSASLVGKTVSVSTKDSTGASSTLTGTVGAIEVINGQPQFTLYNPNTKAYYANANGTPLTFPTSQIIGLGR